MKKYTRKTNPVEAVRFDVEHLQFNFMKIGEWCKGNGIDCEIMTEVSSHKVRLYIVGEKRLSVDDKDWVVLEDGEYKVYPDDLFNIQFEEMEAPEERQSNLVDHAKRELEIIGEEPEVVDAYLKIVRIFADMGHSGSSAMFAIPVIEHLLSFKPLSELTDDPDDWVFHGADVWGEKDGIWQNRRNGQAFSKDGGKSYYLLSDNSNAKFQTKMYKSKAAKK